MSSQQRTYRLRDTGLRPAFKLMVSALIAVGAIVLSLPLAQAATYTYVNTSTAANGQVFQSGTKPSLTGGSVNTSLGVGEQTIKTYRAHPGYKVLSQATSSTSSVTRISHPRYKNVSSSCNYFIPHVKLGTGRASMVCKASS